MQNTAVFRARRAHSGIRLDVSALYVMCNSVYKTLCDAWDIQRDARQWAGPGPCVAHPPCGHWGKYHHVCRKPGKDCGPRAFEQVRRFGGVLEHPEHSALFVRSGAPLPGGQRDFFGGWTLAIEQADFGHRAVKRTWLYIVGRDDVPPMPAGLRREVLRPVERLTDGQRSATPPAFASWLVELAAGCVSQGVRDVA